MTDADYRIGLLIDAIRDIGVAAGVLREDIGGMSGPEALMFAAETADHVRTLAALAESTKVEWGVRSNRGTLEVCSEDVARQIAETWGDSVVRRTSAISEWETIDRDRR